MTRLMLAFSGAVFVAVSFADAKDGSKYVLPVQDSIPAFIDMSSVGNGNALFHFYRTDRLNVLRSEGKSLEVRDALGRTAWVEQKMTAKVSHRQFSFEDAYVVRDFQQPDPFFILDMDEPLNGELHLQRSFSESLRDKIDRPTGKRMTGQGPDRSEFF